MVQKTAMREAFERINNPWGMIREALTRGAGIKKDKANYNLSYRTFTKLKQAGVIQ